MTLTTKRCSRCKQEKEVSAFSKRKRAKDGLESCCKTCKFEFEKETHARRVAKGPDPIPPGSMKRCSRCKEEKPQTLEFFYKLKRAKDGLQSWCKPCTVETTKANYVYSENRSYTPSSCLYIAELPWELDHRDLLKVGISSMDQRRPWDYGDSLPEIFNWPDTPDGQEACAAAERVIKSLRTTEATQGDWGACGPIRTPAGRTEVYLPTHRARIREIAIEHGGQAMGRITYSLRNQSRR